MQQCNIKCFASSRLTAKHTHLTHWEHISFIHVLYLIEAGVLETAKLDRLQTIL